MADVILFKPKAELDAAGNMRGFIEACRNQLSVFGADLDFNENNWDVTSALGLKARGNKRVRITFRQLNDVATRNSGSMMAEPFRSFAKAYVRYSHGLRPTKIIQNRLVALRALEKALSENGATPDPVSIDTGIFNRAAQLAASSVSQTVAYRVGGQLELLAEFLMQNRLTIVPARWRNSLPRPTDTVRVGKEFDDRRREKLPSQSALDALPKIFRLATLPAEVIVSSIAAILCSAPDRISEVLLLAKDCEVRQRNSNYEAYGLRWWPAKGADPMIKWIVPSMSSVVQEAIAKIRSATEGARLIATWYEKNPHQIYLPEQLVRLRRKEWLSMGEVGEILGLTIRTAPLQWCKGHYLITRKEGRHTFVRFTDVERAVIDMLPIGFPILDQTSGLKFSEALLVVRKNELHEQRGTYRCMIEPVTTDQINNGLGSANRHGKRSIFERLGFAEQDGSPIRLTTHQFRHFLNTLAQAGGMSQLDIAKWSGRKDVRQNNAYDHMTSDQMLQKIREAVGDQKNMFGPLAELPKRVLIPRDEFARLKIPTAHTTDVGFCVHDYTMSPCQMHLDCINCEELVCVKGDVQKAANIKRRLAEANELLDRAERATQEGYMGGDRWMVHHQATVSRLAELNTILEDPTVPNGAVVQLSTPNMPSQIIQAADDREVLKLESKGAQKPGGVRVVKEKPAAKEICNDT